MRIFKRGTVYWFELVFEGKRYQKSTKERNKIKAEGIAAKFRTSLAERRVGIIQRKPAPEFNRAVREYRPARNCKPRELNGGRGIRTPGTVPRTAVFKTAGFNRSPIPPFLRILPKTEGIPGIGS